MSLRSSRLRLLPPRDMDFLEAKHAAAREIALAFGVPPMLLDIPGDNTFANCQERTNAACSPRSANSLDEVTAEVGRRRRLADEAK